jgi:hypothetical protein
MLIIPTSELIGLLTDVLGFSPVIKDDPRRGVLIEWDGENLHASAYDVLSAGRATWMPGEGQESIDDKDGEVGEMLPTDMWGGDDPAWKAFVTYDDAKDVIKAFKVASKLWWIPLSVKISPTGGKLTVERSGDYGKPAALVTVAVDRDVTAKFPDVSKAYAALYDDWNALDDTINVISFSPYRLAAFGTVRAHGTLVLRFAGEQGAVSASMGSRFVGFIFPDGARKAEASAILSVAGDQAGSDLLRHGAGVILTPLTEPEWASRELAKEAADEHYDAGDPARPYSVGLDGAPAE